MDNLAKKTMVLLACLAALPVFAAPHTSATLLLDARAAQPGDTVMAAVRLRMDPGWHTYWKNPGGSGMATQIEWQLPPGITAGTTQWPVPNKLPEQEFTTYIYQDEAVLLTPLKLGQELAQGPIEIKAKVSWLECEVQCVPGDSSVNASLLVASRSEPSENVEMIKQARAALPKAAEGLNPRAWWAAGPKDDTRPFVIEWKSSAGIQHGDFYPYASDDFEVQAESKSVSAPAGFIRLQKTVKKYSGDWPKEIAGLLIASSASGTNGYEAKLTMQAGELATQAVGPASVSVSPGLVQMLLYALIGGMILNIMPCVLPVIALKVLGFVSQARDEPRRVRGLGIIYALGVLASFLVLAGLVIGVKAAGHKAGWGMQFGNPQFLVLLTILVTLVALNLFGLFEINPGARVLGAAGSLASKHGAAGAFFNGVLATVLATPCTAPFLGAALGFAFAQPAPLVILMFLTVGLGLALPYVLLSWNPGWLKFLPKPGPWMETFKIAMGFPMLATAFWLFSLIPIHYGERSWWLGIFLVVVGFAAWIYGRFVQRAGGAHGIALAVVAGILLAGYAFIVEGQLKWRAPETAETATTAVANSPGSVQWVPWSPEAVTEARAAGRPVLVDFTAKWCLTCNTIVKPALESAAVREKIKEINAVALLGDYTRFPRNITEELNRYGRAGVPLVLVFPKDTNKETIILPEAVTPGMVVDALEKSVL